MKESRTKERLISGAWEDFVVKVYTKNESPEFLIATVETISEIGMSGTIELGAELAEKDVLSGMIESDLTRSKIKYSGTVVWTRETKGGIQFGLKFSEELLLPDVIIALSMAAA